MSDSATDNATDNANNVLTCPYCGKTYPASKRNAYNMHVYRHKRKRESFREVGPSGESTPSDLLESVGSGAVGGASVGGGGVERVDNIPDSEVGSETRAAALAEIPPAGAESVEGAAEEQKAFVGLRNVGRIVSSLYRGLLSRAGLESLSDDEVREIEAAFSDENLNIPASPKVAAVANLMSALAAPIARRAPQIAEKFKFRPKHSAPKAPEFFTPSAPVAGADRAGARGTPPESPNPAGGNEGGDTASRAPVSTYQDELAAAQKRYQEIMERLHGKGGNNA